MNKKPRYSVEVYNNLYQYLSKANHPTLKDEYYFYKLHAKNYYLKPLGFTSYKLHKRKYNRLKRKLLSVSRIYGDEPNG